MDQFGWIGAGVVLGVTGSAWWSPTPSVAVGMLCVATSWWILRGPLARLLCGIALGLLIVASMPLGPAYRGIVSVQGTVVTASQGGWVQLEGLRSRVLGGSWRPDTGRVLLRLPRGIRVAPGAKVVAYGKASAPHQRILPGAPDPVRNARRARIRTYIETREFSVVGATPMGRQLPPMLQALATGDRRRVDPEHLALLRRTGTSHLLAISGFHVGLVSWFLVGALARVLAGTALWRPEGIPSSWVAVAPGLIAGCFALSVGAPISAQRAAILVALLGIARARQRHIDAMSFLGLAATGVLCADPTAVGTPSFQLSFGAVAGLLTWGPALTRLVPPDLPALARGTASGCIASTAATMGTLPASAWWFQSLAAVGLITNLWAVPLTMGLVACALGAAYLPPPIAGVASVVGAWGCDLLLWGLSWFDVAPLTPAVGPWTAVLCCGVFLVRWPSLGAALVLFGLALRPTPTDRATLTILDVGQGSAALATWPDGRRWLIDGGYPNRDVLAWLRREGIRTLDVVVATHGDLDHVGGLKPVLEHLEVGALRLSGFDGLDELRQLARDRGVPIVDDPATRLYPQAPTGQSRNEDSIVLQAEHAGLRALLPADIGPETEEDLVDWIGPADVLVLSHHGSSTSTSQDFLDTLRPSLAVVSVGRDNRYRHPSTDVVERVRRQGIPLLRTDLHGTIELSMGEAGLSWRTYRAGEGWSLTQSPDLHDEPATIPTPPSTARGSPLERWR